MSPVTRTQFRDPVRVGKLNVPFYLYSWYILSPKSDLTSNDSEEKKIVEYASWWFNAHAHHCEDAWKNAEIGNEVEPLLADILFQPTEEHIEVDGAPFCNHHLVQSLQLPEGMIPGGVGTIEGKKAYLLWHYQYSALAGNLISAFGKKWLRRWVTLPCTDRTDVLVPWGLKIFTFPHMTAQQNMHILWGVVMQLTGFTAVWLPEYEDFFSRYADLGSFGQYLQSVYDTSEKRQVLFDTLRALVIQKPWMAEWENYLCRQIGIEASFVNSEIKVPFERIEKNTLPSLNDGVSVLGFPKSEFGVGEVTRTTILALHEAGCQVEGIDLENRSSSHPGKDKTVDDYLSKVSRQKINILSAPIHFPGVMLTEGYSLSFFEKRYFIGYAPWEFNQWNPRYDFSYRFYDEIWAPTRFVEEAFSGKGIPVTYLPYAVVLGSFSSKSRSELSLPHDQFLFFAMFDFNSSIERKNPIATVRAFRKAFSKNESVGLVIKASYANESNAKWIEFLKEIDGDPRIQILNQVMARSELSALMNEMDAFVSLHRSEGFGLGLAEAMLLNKPVIATQYSGNVDFCGDQWSFPVEHQMVKVKAGEYPFAEGFAWADPILESAVAQFKKVYAGGAGVEKIVAAGKKNIEENFSLKACGERFAQRLAILR